MVTDKFFLTGVVRMNTHDLIPLFLAYAHFAYFLDLRSDAHRLDQRDPACRLLRYLARRSTYSRHIFGREDIKENSGAPTKGLSRVGARKKIEITDYIVRHCAV
jgi:hypothetical protein